MSKVYDAQEVLERIAKAADALAFQAGVGAMETAGGLLGYLVDHPRDLEPFMNRGLGSVVRAHWRGDPALGIKRTRYRVTEGSPA